MNEKLKFHPKVYLDIQSSYDWYEEQLLGLGYRFLLELEDGFQSILNFPKTWANFKFGFKRYILNKFPFSIIYKIEENSIYILAVMHNRKKPNFFIKRLD